MGSVRFDIISIGTLSRNRLWGETQALRTPHATTTLIRATGAGAGRAGAGERRILVDPGLPAAALGARLFERTGLRGEQIDTVFLTNFRASHRSGLALFEQAKIYLHEVEQQSAHQQLSGLIEQAPPEDLDRKIMERELKLLERCEAAPDRLAEQVDLFPLFGYTPGQCGLLLAAATSTVLIAGDAVPTAEHFLSGQVLADAFDIAAAQESMREVYEIADLIVPGHDNVFMNPRTGL